MGYLGQGVRFANVAGDTFTGDGSTTDFTMTHTPGTKHAIDVYLAGVWQHKSTFSISGTTLSFDVAPPDQVEIAVEYRGLPINIGTPADDSVGRAQIDVTSMGPVVQQVYTTDSAFRAVGTANCPEDDTIPQANGTELVQYTQLDTAITPKHASNILLIEAEVRISNVNFGGPYIVAVLEAADTEAQACNIVDFITSADQAKTIRVRHRVAAGGTVAQTWEVWVSRIGASGSVEVNGSSGAAFGSTSFFSSLMVTEYLVAN